jgi:thiamine kinase-like enzyme
VDKPAISSPAASRNQHLLLGVLRIGMHTLWDTVTRPSVHTLDEVPASVETLTPEWLTAVLCRDTPDARVQSFELSRQSSGSSVRRQISLTYNDAGERAGLPRTVFAKSTPGFLHRLLNGLGGSMQNEALFYRRIRPELNLEAPICYYSAYDLSSCRSLHLFEDLRASRNASFCTPKTSISLAQARDIVGVLASLHGRYYGLADLPQRFPWLKNYAQLVRKSQQQFNFRRYHERSMTEAAAVIPADLLAQREKIWPFMLRSLDSHEKHPQTIIHNDVHLGNWYVTGDGRMGLCDWQTTGIGCWGRDLAYAIAATLTVENRRNWEKELLELYLHRMHEITGQRIEFQQAWPLYREQISTALLWWTITLNHSPLMPDMQPPEISLEMIKRLATAMSDLRTLDGFEA